MTKLGQSKRSDFGRLVFGHSLYVHRKLRKKIEERLKLKELLGENSHLYFGALNKNKKNGGSKSKQQQQQQQQQQLQHLQQLHRNSLSSPSISVNHKF